MARMSVLLVTVFGLAGSALSQADAGTLFCGQRVSGSNFFTNRQRYSLYVPESDNVVITTCYGATDFDTVLTLYNEFGVEVDRNDDGACSNRRAEIETFLFSGDYEVEVSGFASRSGLFDICVDCGNGGCGSNTGTIVGAVIGALVFVCIIGAIAYVCANARKNRNPVPPAQRGMVPATGTTGATIIVQPTYQPPPSAVQPQPVVGYAQQPMPGQQVPMLAQQQPQPAMSYAQQPMPGQVIAQPAYQPMPGQQPQPIPMGQPMAQPAGTPMGPPPAY